MAKVAKEIIFIKIDCGKPFSYVENQFYAIMRKYRIKQGTRCKKTGEIMVANFEWTMCYSLFFYMVGKYYPENTMLGKLPDDLECY